MPDPNTYEVLLTCRNCGNRQFVKKPYGVPLGDPTCLACGCEARYGRDPADDAYSHLIRAFTDHHPGTAPRSEEVNAALAKVGIALRDELQLLRGTVKSIAAAFYALMRDERKSGGEVVPFAPRREGER